MIITVNVIIRMLYIGDSLKRNKTKRWTFIILTIIFFQVEGVVPGNIL